MTFNDSLKQILGREPGFLEFEAFSFFNRENYTPEKRFHINNQSMPMYLNIDDEYFCYITIRRSREEAILDLASRGLTHTFCADYRNVTLMGGLTDVGRHAENSTEKQSLDIVFLPFLKEQISTAAMRPFIEISQEIESVWQEAIWERLCRVCVRAKKGCHVTLSKKRAFNENASGLLCFIKPSDNKRLKAVCEKLDIPCIRVGKTLSFPVVSYDCGQTLLEIPVSALRKIISMSDNYQRPEHHVNFVTQKDTREISEEDPTNEDILNLVRYVRADHESRLVIDCNYGNGQPKLNVELFTPAGLAFSENGIRLQMLKSILKLKSSGKKIIACSYVMKSGCKHPVLSKSMLLPLKEIAGLFKIPVSNGICLNDDNQNEMLLFFITRDMQQSLPETFQEETNFVALLGDPNGTLSGSAFSRMKGYESVYDPPGVVTGTAAAVLDVLNECRSQDILNSVTNIGEGGVAYALYKACSGGKGAIIYSERKSPKQQFLFGEPQAAVMISMSESRLMDLARITSRYNMSAVTIGRVSSQKNLQINDWIDIIPVKDDYKQKGRQ